MTFEEVREILGRHKAELAAMGVLSLSVFGSVARGEARPDSDVDLLVELDPDRRIELLDFYRIQDALADLLGCEVDLVEPEALQGTKRSRIMGEAIHAA